MPLSSNNSNREDKNSDVHETLISKILLYKVTNLIKIYQDEGKKFREELYDILRAKLQVFQDCCNKIRIQYYQYHHAFSVMLKGCMAIFYYNYITGKYYNFNTML
jgi:hypothetical protein